MIKQWMELVGYRITDGSGYQWQCYGDEAYSLDSWDGDHKGKSFCVIFDKQTNQVYELQAHDFKNQRAYRWVNPEYIDAMTAEATRRNVNHTEAWEDVNYVSLEVVDDFYQKASAIMSGVEYDTRVSVPIELPDEELFQLMRMAHERDITLNQLVEEALRLAIENMETV
jgi:hypothetical protein